jgi:hypothetical protein
MLAHATPFFLFCFQARQAALISSHGRKPVESNAPLFFYFLESPARGD